MIIWNLFELMVNLFQVMIIVQIISKCLGEKQGIRSQRLKVATILILFLELSFINELDPFEGIAIVIPILIIFLYAILALEGEWIKKLYWSALLMVLVIGITAVVFNILGFFWGYSYVSLVENQGSERFSGLIIIQIMLFYFSRLLINQKDRDEGQLEGSMWLAIIIIPLLSVVTLTIVLELSILVKEEFRDLGQKIALALVIGILAINIAAYFMYAKLKKELAEKLEYELLKQRYAIREKNLNELKDLYYDLRKVKHDHKQHLNLIKVMLHNEQTSKAIEYLEKYETSEYSGKFDKVYSDNEFIHYIINSKADIMRNKEIKFYCVLCDNIQGISDVELSIILGNLFDNAVEACEKIEGNKEIVLTVKKKNGYLIIQMENSIKASLYHENFLLQTSKKNREEHGIGISSISDIVKKYDGRIDFALKDNKFLCSIVIDIEEVVHNSMISTH